MQISGHIENGVVILDGGASLPNGTQVYVSVQPMQRATPNIECVPGQLPRVFGGGPGTLYLTNDRIHEILEAEDMEAMKGFWDVPS